MVPILSFEIVSALGVVFLFVPSENSATPDFHTHGAHPLTRVLGEAGDMCLVHARCLLVLL